MSAQPNTQSRATAATAVSRPQATQTPSRAVVARVRWLLLALLVVMLAAPLSATLLQGSEHYAQIARDDPGTLTASLTTLLRSIAALASTITLGGLCWLLVLGRAGYDPADARIVEVRGMFTIRLVRGGALVWLAAATALIGCDAADSNGLGLGRLADPQALGFALLSGDAARAWMVSAVGALVILLVARTALGWTAYAVAFWLGMIACLAPIVVGQVLVGPNHDFGGDAAVIGTVLGTPLLGVIVVQALRVAAGHAPLAWSAGLRHSPAALLGVTGAAGCELLVTWFKLTGSGLPGNVFTTATGLLEVGRLAALCLIAGALLASRGRAERPATIVLSTLGAGAFLTLGVTMTRVWPPQFFVDTSMTQIFLGFDVDTPPSAWVLVSHWRPNLLFLALAFLATAAYVVGLRRLRARGKRWPAMRTLAWMLGWGLVVFTTSSGFGKYSAPDFAVHMGLHMTLSMMAPILIVLGGPMTLALRALPSGGARPDAAVRPVGAARRPGAREKLASLMQSRLLHAVYHPLLVFAIYIGSYYGLYLSSLFGTAMRFHWAHQLMNLHFLLVGCLYFGLVIGVDATPRKLPHLAKLGFLMAAMPFHAFFGVILMSSNTFIAESFYRHLDVPWATDLGKTQEIAGGVAWAGGEVPLLIVVIVLAFQWAIQDGKEAKRIDRRLDSGLDDAGEAYNAMLARLSRIDGSSPGRPSQDGDER